MKKLAVLTVSAIFALGTAQIASAANNGLTGDDKQNYSNSYAYGHDKNNVPGSNNGMGNAFGQRDKVERPGEGNNSIRNSYPQNDVPPNGLGNSFGNTP